MADQRNTSDWLIFKIISKIYYACIFNQSRTSFINHTHLLSITRIFYQSNVYFVKTFFLKNTCKGELKEETKYPQTSSKIGKEIKVPVPSLKNLNGLGFFPSGFDSYRDPGSRLGRPLQILIS
ncbi:hypothetical protein Glove_238g12 [Diversispora epigaea]|uniref:Uncharacterized protein n=1 Tax=Diversispora epigaea TaxID=1348612 RepID=A0A397ID43_9GLOM|nr:hypothetical protein Glove_238g12 [Diversispora epigaea]